jgi:hypothetical protein
LVASIAILVSAAAASAQQTSPRAPSSADFGYPTVAAALEGLRARKDVAVTNEGGWTVVSDNGTRTIWSFTPSGHAAHPAVVKRQITQKNGDIFVEMQGLCEATKSACDKLMAEFEVLNARIRESLQRPR